MLQMQTLTISALLILLSFGNAQAIPTNVALGGTATASNTWNNGSSSPDLAIDSDTTTGWNAGSWPTQWIEIDLGAVYQIEKINALVVQLPNGVTTHDVYLDGLLNFSWSGFTSHGDTLSQTFGSPISAQFVKINTTVSPSWVAWSEIEVWADVPEPGILALMGLGLVGIGFTRRKRM